MLRLVVRHEDRVRRFSLPPAEAVLGSASDCDLPVTFPGISRRHAKLRRLDGGVLVTDLDSKNGLVRDGARLAEVLLRPRDSVKIGRALLELEEVDSSDAAVAVSIASAPERRRRTESSDTGSLTELPGAGSPSAALSVIREVERAGGIDPAQADEARRLLDLARAALESEAVWIWVGSNEGAPAIVALSGALPGEEEGSRLAELAAAEVDPHDQPIGPCTALLAPIAPGRSGLAATLLGSPEKIPDWKRDLFDYLASKLKKAPKRKAAADREEASGDANPLRFPDEFVRGESLAIQKLLAALATAARSHLDVLLLGETGTGKEMIARAIHDSGPTAKGPFLAINCAAIPAELLEAQLFGVEARVATGVDPRPGLFLKANGGSLFLDEIGDLPEPMQAKLLRALQEREILPVGSTSPRRITVRVISASNKDLGEMVRQGSYRADFYYRLRGLQFHMPPLRDRPEDLPLLVVAFAQRAALNYEKRIVGVSRKALDLLARYDWPGNVRELKSEVERAVLLCPDGGALEASHFSTIAWAVGQRSDARPLSGEMAPAPPCASEPRIQHAGPQPAPEGVPFESLDLSVLIARVERSAIQSALARFANNKSAAARALGISRAGLQLKMRRLEIS